MKWSIVDDTSLKAYRQPKMSTLKWVEELALHCINHRCMSKSSFEHQMCPTSWRNPYCHWPMLGNHNLVQRESFRKLSNEMKQLYAFNLTENICFSSLIIGEHTFLSSFPAEYGITVRQMLQARFQTTIHFTQWIWIEWIATPGIIFTIALVAFDGGCCY